MGKTSQPARHQVLNRYIRKRFGFACRVNGYLAKYLLNCRSNQQLHASLHKLTAEIGRGVKVDRCGVLQWQPGSPS